MGWQPDFNSRVTVLVLKKLHSLANKKQVYRGMEQRYVTVHKMQYCIHLPSCTLLFLNKNEPILTIHKLNDSAYISLLFT
jgi:hypothetical protein